MNEFDNNEEYYDPNSAKADNSSKSTEENTTYHYAYSNQSDSGQGGQNPYQRTSYYTPPQSNDYRSPSDSTSASFQENTGFGNPPVKKKKNKVVTTLVIVFAICLIISLIGIYAAATGKVPSNKKTDDGNHSNNNSSAQVTVEDQGAVDSKDTDGKYTVAGIAENFIDSCVGITVYKQANSYSNFYSYGYGQNQQGNNSDNEVASGEGSGIVMLEDSGKTYILTCAHVISEGSSFKITMNDGTEYDAFMVGYDAQTDIGVLSINTTGLQVAKFANSDSTVLGEQVVAIGCPGGLQFMNSITSGFVSALARPISSTIGYNTECIQIDAAINPGNSGGALFNMNGQVIGVNSSKIASTEYEGMGFAVPSNTAVETANSLIRVGYVEGRAKLGITYKSISTYSNSEAILSALAKLGFENANGTMVINNVDAESDLANKGIREYDMIVSVNGNTMTSTDVMTSVLAESKPGDTVKLTIARIENNNIDTFEIDCVLIESKG